MAIKSFRMRSGVLLLLATIFGLSCLAKEQTRQMGILKSTDGSPVADAPFHVFTYSPAALGLIELSSGKTGKNGEFSYPFKQADTQKFFSAFFFADIPGSGRFVEKLRTGQADPLVLKAWGPWADLVVTFMASNGKPARGLHGRVVQVYDTSPNGFLSDVPALPAGTWDAVTDSNGRLILRGLPTQCRFYLEMDDARYAQLMGLHSSSHWFAPGKPQSVKLIPAGSISGRITFPDGTPAKGVSVRALEQYNYEEAGGGGGQNHTDAGGRFTISRLRPATYDLIATLTPEQSEHWAAPVRTGMKLGLAENAANQDIWLTKGALITGKVTNSETGKLIAGQGLTIGLVPADQTSPLGQLWAKTVDGRYRTRIPAGPHRVYLGSSPSGFERGEGAPILVNTKDDEEVSVDFQLKPKGKQFHVTGNVIGANGEPAAGAGVHVLYTKGFEASDTTDSAGNFSIEVPKNIKDEVPIYASDGPRRSPMQKAAAGKPATLKLGDENLATIRGRVVDEQGTPIQSATVDFQLAEDVGGWQNTLTTDPAGRFELSDAWSDVTFNVSGRASGFGCAKKKAVTAPGEKLDLGDLVLKKADRMLEGIAVDPDGKPAFVSLSVSGDSNQPLISGKSDSEGRFLLTGLVDGKVSIRASQKLGGRFVTIARAKAQAGDRQIKLIIKRADATLRGRLVNAAKQPIAGAMVVTDDHEQPGEISAVSANDGTFRLTGVFPGWLTVKVMTAGNSKSAMTLRGKAGSEESLLMLPVQSAARAENTPVSPAERARVDAAAPRIEPATWINSPPLPLQNRGTVRILDFWNIFCGPCVANLPKQQEFWEAHRRNGLEMIALHPAWNELEIREFLAKRPNIRFPIAIEKEGSPAFDRYAIRAAPTYVVIGPDGKVEFIGAGDWEGAKAKAISLLEALAKKRTESR